MRKLNHDELQDRQQKLSVQPKLPFTVVLNNIRSIHNVGSIFRSCDGAGVEKLWLCGITAYPPNAQLSKTALGSEDCVKWDHSRDVIEVVRELKNRKYQIVLLEQTDRSIPYQDFHPDSAICLVVGNEIEGTSEELSSLADAAIEIEMTGTKNSLNVSVAFGIASYHIRNCLKQLQ